MHKFSRVGSSELAKRFNSGDPTFTWGLGVFDVSQ
jgi:hypothetical protein